MCFFGDIMIHQACGCENMELLFEEDKRGFRVIFDTHIWTWFYDVWINQVNLSFSWNITPIKKLKLLQLY